MLSTKIRNWLNGADLQFALDALWNFMKRYNFGFWPRVPHVPSHQFLTFELLVGRYPEEGEDWSIGDVHLAKITELTGQRFSQSMLNRAKRSKHYFSDDELGQETATNAEIDGDFPIELDHQISRGSSEIFTMECNICKLSVNVGSAGYWNMTQHKKTKCTSWANRKIDKYDSLLFKINELIPASLETTMTNHNIR
ncbi:hypothetical protein GGX14DRAFT_394031 [Mycena pura]|uniref:Uncharacterized protein n=1 Tax=Mycena pura TaxID=153505 RepID=A0AAD6VFT1_9AGAR|nr:hypothetical protein GGX14DRAFT_394031 [Mycena pura]